MYMLTNGQQIGIIFGPKATVGILVLATIGGYQVYKKAKKVKSWWDLGAVKSNEA